ncbi:MAG: choice-of-anchor D domain-containing protein [Silvibacterium sp.]
MRISPFKQALFSLTICAVLSVASLAQQAPADQALVVDRINDTRLLQLHGNTHPLARAEYDKGALDPAFPMERMMLALKRSPEREEALEAFMEGQLNPASADYHNWLTPEEFGALYGPSEYDIQAVTNWLQNHGFTVDQVTNGRTLILFSGNAGQVHRAFHTEMHRYMVNGEEHIANNVDPSIPEALSPVVAGIASLNNFFAKPLHRVVGNVKRDAQTGKWTLADSPSAAKPLLTVPGSSPTFEMVAPYDFATIYNVAPLWTAGTDGTGQTIAIAGRSDISASDVATFRSSFGLPAKAPTIIVNGADPGVPSTDDKVENTLDVEWSGAVAKGATIKFVTTKSTATSDGAYASALYIVDNNVAPVMSYSYGACELAFGTSGNAAYNSLWQQGASEGISEFVASGDQGSAACDGGGTPPDGANNGLAVSGSSTTPYNTAVGGTDFDWANLSTHYWNSTNASNDSSALSYIPEVPWNSSCASLAALQLYGFTAAGLDQEQSCQYMINNNFDIGMVTVAGGTGGKSACTTPTGTTPSTCAGGYTKPTWQTGTGVPADGKRDVPDVALFAADGLLNDSYVICDTDLGACTYTSTAAEAQGVGGTSVASPAMAGIMALIVQKMGGAKQGNVNPALYALAAKDNRTSCASSTVASGNACNFYDITTDNNAVPCIPGSLNCTVKHAGDTVAIIGGYNSGTGFDLTTGLGSVNAKNLVTNWALVAGAPAVSLTPTSMTFASTTVGSTSAAQIATLKNTGTATLTITSIGFTGTNPSSFIKSATTCGTTLASGLSCTISAEFKPTTTGTLKASLSVADNASGSPHTVSLTGTGAAPTPAFSITPISIAFPSSVQGAMSAAQVITVKNTGTVSATISSIALTGNNPTSFVQIGTCGATLAVGATCDIFAAFAPAATGALSAAVTLTDNATGSPQKVTLTGTGTAALTVKLSATSISFPTTTHGTVSAAQSIAVTNSGTATLNITSIALAGTNPTDFVQVNTCGPTLAPSASCVIYVAFKPAAAAAYNASIKITDNGTSSPQSIALSGTGK